MGGSITGRKNDHLRIALEEPVESSLMSGATFGGIQLVHRALPGLNLDDIDTSVDFLGKKLAFPLIVGSMTGGTEAGQVINQRIAEACRTCGIGMSVGSQRVMLEQPATQHTFEIRAVAPEILLIGNLGAVQLNRGVQLEQIEGLIQSIGADALVLHLNAAQEAIQEGGDVCFGALRDRIEDTASQLSVPCGVKEVGGGFSIDDVRSLANVELAFLESAGKGGTSWTLIEGKRANERSGRNMGDLFSDWGIPSATSLLSCLRYGASIPVIASGGLRSGLDAARALALGASVTAMALPVLKAAHDSVGATVEVLREFERSLRASMFLTGARTIGDLATVPVRIVPSLFPEVYEGHRPGEAYYNRAAPLLDDQE